MCEIKKKKKTGYKIATREFYLFNNACNAENCPDESARDGFSKPEKNPCRKHKSRLQAAFVLRNYRLPIEKSKRERERRERAQHTVAINVRSKKEQ